MNPEQENKILRMRIHRLCMERLDLQKSGKLKDPRYVEIQKELGEQRVRLALVMRELPMPETTTKPSLFVEKARLVGV